MQTEMHILNTVAPIAAPGGSAVALGYFDGVHLGHRRVLGAAADCARRRGLTAAPRWVLPSIWNPPLRSSAP